MQDGQAGATPWASCPGADEDFELPQAVRDGILEMHKNWNNRLETEEFNISEEYIKGRLGILIEFNRESWADRCHSRGAIWPQAKGMVLKYPDNAPIWAYNLDVTHFGYADQGRYDGMLLKIVEC